MATTLWTSRLRGFSLPFTDASPPPCLLHAGSGYAPFIDRFLPLIRPGSDEFIGEKYAAEIEVSLKSWQEAFRAFPRGLQSIHDTFLENLEGSLLNRANIMRVRATPPVQSDRVTFPGRSV